ncbi:preprotein translocase subunit SecA [Fodinicurvata halophila]|uniref:Protein translocase subunit SecA n=1 Tax=Fodinicurvata halophila TaxID=1419723 RepID=A0ABV8UM18_9PROT
MLSAIAKRLFGSANDRYIKSLRRDVEAINALEPELETLDDEALRARTFQFRERLENGETLDDIRVEAFATVREAAKRTLGQRHFDVQMIGGIVLHKGMIAEMKTGEGKTLVATLAVYLNALSGKGVHVVTVNDYLARRDSEWMGQIYRFLGLTVGCVVPGVPDAERREQYACDVTYATNNELGFDYLRDNMKYRLEDMVQREFNYAIVDEVDSILIDESRTPLIISGPAEDSSDMYMAVDKIMPKISEEHYEKDEKARSVTLTDEGTEYVEELLQAEGLIEEGSLYDIQNVGILHHVTQALRAHVLFNRDTDYIVKDDKVVIIDEFTGRMMEGRRYSEGLHQALEAKEGVTIQNENQTLASITFQNFFRLYPKLAGMTGTAVTEASEFGEIYGLEVVEIPTNEPVQRIDYDDEVYRSADEKYTAIIDQIDTCQQRGQPVLVGTVSIEKSEHLSEMLKKRKIDHQVLNARYHEQEAYIIAQAGAPGAVTIATNMAGRGTDIQLGGNADMRIQQEAMTLEDETARQAKIEELYKDIEEKRARAMEGGGLFVLGTERHESRRIDNQLRGRSGRQGDPGGSKFFLSLEDDLMRIFGSERMDGMLKRLGLQEGEAIKHTWVNRALEKAQEKVEARNYEIRKNLLRFDDVMNDQRKVIFEQRKDMMRADDVHDTILGMRDDVTANLVARCIPPKAYAEQWDIDTLHEECLRLFGLDLPVHDWAREEGIADEEILERIRQAIEQKMQEKEAAFGAELMRTAEKQILLSTMDKQWKEHLLALDHLRQSVGLRAYAQRNPLNEYKAEAFNHFETMLANVREEVTLLLCHVNIRVQEPESLMPKRGPQQMQESREDPAFAEDRGAGRQAAPAGSATAANTASGRSGAAAAAELDPNDPSTWTKTGRNASCPCGSGKKYKHCHGKLN